MKAVDKKKAEELLAEKKRRGVPSYKARHEVAAKLGVSETDLALALGYDAEHHSPGACADPSPASTSSYDSGGTTSSSGYDSGGTTSYGGVSDV